MDKLADRVKINGEWYVKEDTLAEHTVKKMNEDDVTYFEGYIYEDEYCMFEATRLDEFDDVAIKFVDKINKERKDWKEDFWDNKSWMFGVYNNNPESMEHAKEVMDGDVIDTFKQFLGFLFENGWL